MKKTTILIGMVFVSFAGFSQQMVTGYVFEDGNGNGKKERREKGIPDVPVSNGREVVLTDMEGKYTLPVGNDQIIFVIKPTDYALPKNENNLPEFYYIHKPEGSPSLQYPGVMPTGPLPKSVDFALVPNQEDSKFTALVFGDPQPYNLEEVAYFEKGIVEEVKGIKEVAFGISLGDLVGDDLSLFPHYANVIGKVGVPWFSVMGNHDQNYDVDRDELADETFEAHFGPSTYAFNYGKVHFIVLDNILYPDPRDGQGYWGGLRSDQLEFVENNLEYVPKDYLVVLAMHIPLFEESDSFRDADRERLFELLAGFPNTLSLSAHTHYQRQYLFSEEDGWKQSKPHHHYNVGTPSGDWYKGVLDENGIPVSTMRDGTPKGYVFLDFDGNAYTARYKVAGKPSDYQMEIFAPKVLEKDKRTSAGIFVNFFMGSQENEVMFRINGDPWRKMTYVDDYDPTYLIDLLQWDTTEELLKGRRPSNPQRSKHLWRANIPVDLPVGEHKIEVEATDRYGNKHHSGKTFRILE